MEITFVFILFGMAKNLILITLYINLTPIYYNTKMKLLF